MAYKGRYTPQNPQKYRGNPHKIVYRSLWERKFMVYCDNNTSVLEWGSEEVIIPYLSPWDGRIHRYFPDFYIKVKQADDSIKKYIIEVKPKKQCKPPPEKPQPKNQRPPALEVLKHWLLGYRAYSRTLHHMQSYLRRLVK